MDPSGHIPGYHIPGTLVVDQWRQAEQAAAEVEAQRVRRNLLLLLR
jgi:hypothetical protein